jgi:hypothetical protein
MSELHRKGTVDERVFTFNCVPEISQHHQHHKRNKKEGKGVFRKGLSFIACQITFHAECSFFGVLLFLYHKNPEYAKI